MDDIPADVPTIGDLEGVFGNLIGSVLALAGIVLFIMLIVGGIKYITSGSDPKAVEGAKKTLSFAIGGMVLIAVSYLILLIIEGLTGAKITEFKIIGS